MENEERHSTLAEEFNPAELRRLYADGVNITKYLKSKNGIEQNNSEIIEMAYELQSGSYVDALKDPCVRDFKLEYAALIAAEISSLCTPGSVLEAGVGEATTLGFVAKNLGHSPAYYGFDLSWSRLAIGRKWLREEAAGDIRLATGDLMNMPYGDSSIDVVYTSHSIEPNGGREAQILRELYRVTKKYLILLEPDYENAPPEAQARMKEHGYCTNLVGTAKDLGMDVLKHALFPKSINPLNPTGLTVIRKPHAPSNDQDAAVDYSCPVSGKVLRDYGGFYFSEDSLLAYPVIDGIPCLRKKQAIVCSCLSEIVARP